MAKRNKTKKHVVSQQKKDDLKKLKKAGVYKPKNPHKAPTKYALSLLSKFSDIVTGNAKAVKVERSEIAQYKLEDGKPGQVRAKGDRVIVPIQKGEKARYSKKRKEIEVSRSIEGGARYVRTPFHKRPRNFDDLKAQLHDGDKIAVAYYRGKKKPVDWLYFDLDDFYNTFIGGYADAASEKEREKALKWALESAQINRYEAPKK